MVTLMFRSPMEACSMKYQDEKLLWSLSTCMRAELACIQSCSRLHSS